MPFTPQNFQDKLGPVISSAWLNPIDVLVYSVLQGAQTNPAAIAALFSQGPLPIVNGGTGAVDPVDALANLGGLPATSFTQKGIGALLYPQTAAEVAAAVAPTNINDMPLPVIDAARYGVVADGNTSSPTDNGQSLTNALKVIQQMGGGVLQLPPGVINYSIGLVPGPNTIIQGQGPAATTLQYTGSGVAYHLTGGFAARCGLQRLILQGKSIVTGTIGIQVGDSNFSGVNHFEDVWVQNFDTGCILSGALWTRFVNCWFQNNNNGVDFNSLGGSVYSTTVSFYDCVWNANNFQAVKATHVPVNNQSVKFYGCTIQGSCLSNLALPQMQFHDSVGGIVNLTIDSCYFEAVASVSHVDLAIVGPFKCCNNYMASGNNGFIDSIGGASNAGAIFGNFFIVAGQPISMTNERSISEFLNQYSRPITLTGAGCTSLGASGLASWPNAGNRIPTPTIIGSGGGTPTYSENTGVYSIVGNVVTVQGSIITTGLGGLTGNVSIQNAFPVLVASNLPIPAIVAVEISGCTPSGSNNQFYGKVLAGSSTMLLMAGGTASPAQVTATQLAAATTINWTAQYSS